MLLKEQIHLDKCPQHVAIIMDGNGRWAKQQGKIRLFGHHSGVEAIRQVLKGATEIGIRYLTLYAFSTENWNRPKEEVDGLMNLLVESIANEIDELNENKVRIRVIGDVQQLPDNCRTELQKAMEITRNNQTIDVILALNYSAHWEIMNAVKNVVQKVEKGVLKSEDIDESVFIRELSLKDIPDPELLIRTSGEYRISNFLLWQIAYAELYFTDTLWPDFSKDDFFHAIIDYQNRERRFGRVSEQLKK